MEMGEKTDGEEVPGIEKMTDREVWTVLHYCKLNLL